MVTIALTLMSALAVSLAVAVAVMWRRMDADARTLRSVDVELGEASGDESLLMRVRELVREARDEQVAAATYQAALDGAQAGIAILSSSGEISYVNRPAATLLEGDGQRAVLSARTKALAIRVARTRDLERMEVDVHEPDRRVLALTAAPAVVDGGSDPIVFVYLEDLSEKRRVDAMRTDFVANASHELKTPLGALALLAETLADVTDDEQRVRLAARLESEAARAARVVDDILRLAETESLGTEHVPVHVTDLVERAAAAVEGSARKRGVELIDDGVVDAVVRGDEDQLISAIRNLLDNAITYTAAKDGAGSVRYRTAIVDDRVEIEVEDTGIGIPVRYRDRVFERFFRVDRARSRESGGTGLGLSIVRNVARVHGGSVAVRSEVGEGSTFTIRLPVVPAAAGEGLE